MKHLFVPYEIALALKEKGFDERCILYYSDGMLQLQTPVTLSPWKTKDLVELNTYDRQPDKRILAPLYQQVCDWFFDNHSLSIEVEIDYATTDWRVRIQRVGKIDPEYVELLYSDKYQALNKAIEEALKLIDNQ